MATLKMKAKAENSLYINIIDINNSLREIPYSEKFKDIVPIL